MEIVNTNIDKNYIIKNFYAEDDRGYFVKTYNQHQFYYSGLDYHFKESFYSVSYKNVLRGMHFQKYPHNHHKLVHVLQGEILDVVVCIKGDQKGLYFSKILNDKNNLSMLIPDNCAHGFVTLSQKAIVSYMTTTIYNSEHDTGIKYDSFGFNWDRYCDTNNLIISNRDKNFKGINE